MNLYLVRHGQAVDGGDDAARTLSPEGENEAAVLAGFIARCGIDAEEVWHSEKTRARQTAEILARDGLRTEALSEKRGLAPNDPVEPIVDILSGLDEDLCIVSHLPFVSTLASVLLAKSDLVAWSFGTCSMLGLVREGSGRWWVNWFVNPSLIRRLGG